MNVENILKVADAIEQASVPGLGFNMSFMLRPVEPGERHHGDSACGTVGCIAGWAYTLAKGAIEHAYYAAEVPAAEWLGLEREAAKALFYPCEDNSRDGQFGRWDDITPRQAVRCLRNLAITGKVDWEAAMKPADPVLPPVPVRTATKATA